VQGTFHRHAAPNRDAFAGGIGGRWGQAFPVSARRFDRFGVSRLRASLPTGNADRLSSVDSGRLVIEGSWIRSLRRDVKYA